MAKNNQFCYMCGKSVNEVNKLIKGEYGYICDSCISIASDLLNDEEEENITNNMQLATPSQIKAHLDQYVIGQDEAKRTLAVAVYNHYKRCMIYALKYDCGIEIPLKNICGVDVGFIQKSIPAYQKEMAKCFGMAVAGGLVYLLAESLSKE